MALPIVTLIILELRPIVSWSGDWDSIVSVCTVTCEPGKGGTQAGSYTQGSQTSNSDRSVHVLDPKLAPFATPLSDVSCALRVSD